MPLKPPEPMTHPDGLFADPEPTTAGRKWWAFQTRSRGEKACASLLRKRGVAYFLPLVVRESRTRGRTFKACLPFFPGYLFVAGETSAREAMFRTNFVVRELPVHDQPQLARELHAVHTILLGGRPSDPDNRLVKGQAVRIVDGPYAGIEGTVVEDDTGLKVYVAVTLLGVSVAVSVERWMVKATSPGPNVTSAGRC